MDSLAELFVRPVRALVPVVVLLAAGSQVQAAPIAVHLSGEIAALPLPSLFPSVFSVGEEVDISFTYDPDASHTVLPSAPGVVRHFNEFALADLTVTIKQTTGDVVIQYLGSHSAFPFPDRASHIEIHDDATAPPGFVDSVRFEAGNFGRGTGTPGEFVRAGNFSITPGLDLQGFFPTIFSLSLDAAGTPSDLVTDIAQIPDDFDALFANADIVRASIAFMVLDPDTGITTQLVPVSIAVGDIAKATTAQLPAPSGLALLGLGLIVIGRWLARRVG